jgi:tRNA dimethylallyltransferase
LNDGTEHPLIAVVGPTGSGKSDLAIALAEAFGGEIVNCDSVQLYRYLDIGTAKVPAGDRRGIPHHLIDILEPNELFTAGDYIRLARPLLREIAARGRISIIAGGTGFYYRSLMHGLFEGPSRDEALRARLERRSTGALHRLLARFDPTASRRIHPNDRQKMIRALEVCVLARRPITTLHRHNRTPLEGFRVLAIGLDPPRDRLASHIDARCRRMFERGLVDEVRGILGMGFPMNAKALESIGYREALMHLRGEISMEQAVELTQASTRQYAKRQRTWFRREAGVQWLRSFGNQTETIETAKGLVRSHFFLK